MNCLRLALSCLAAFAVAGCVSVESVPATRNTPGGTIEMFKKATAAKNYKAEWDTFSPGFQRRISRMAGRNVDFADYALARRTMRRDTRVQIAESLLGAAVVRNVQMRGEDAARVRVDAPLGKRIDVGLVRLSKWQLYVVGDDQPWEGFTNNSSVRYEKGADGSYTIYSQFDPNAAPSVETFRADQVSSFKEVSLWYIDDLGGMEAQLAGGGGI